jgi:hypothetical protein
MLFMKRWFALPALAMLLSGCVIDSGYRSYDDRYYADDGYREPVHVSGSSYYAPSYGGSGDYYYGDYGYDSSYVAYPYYYSLFWSLNRWSVDPYWHPSFFYGVTYYPRNYFSFGYSRYGHGYGLGFGSHYWPYGIRSYAYSPYRHSWVDHYYDWTPYHAGYSRRAHSYYAPRYGSARNEADWLSRQVRNDRYRDNQTRYGSRDGGLPRTQSYREGDRSRSAVSERREALRGADYGSRTRGRADPGVSGFGYERDPGSKRPSGVRSEPDSRSGARDAGVRGETTRYRAPTVEGRSASGRYIGGSGDVRNSAPTRDGRVLDRGSAPRSGDVRGQRYDESSRTGSPAPVSRGSSREASTEEGYRLPSSRSTYRAPVDSTPSYRSTQPRYQAAPAPSAPRGYDAAPRRSAPVYRQPETRGSSAAPQQYRQPVERATPRYERNDSGQSRSQPTYAPREQPSRAVEQRSYAAPERSEPSRSESRAESRSEPRSDRGGRGRRDDEPR